MNSIHYECLNEHNSLILCIISLVCLSVYQGPENCPLELEVPKTIQDLEFLPPFPRSNCRKWTSSMLQSPSSLCFLFVSAAFQSPRNLQAPSTFFLYMQLSNHLANLMTASERSDNRG